MGQQGLTDRLIRSVDQALDDHELIKIRFNEHKDKNLKKDLIARIESATGCRHAGMIGHTAICFREHPDPQKRSIQLPKKPG